MQFHSRFVVASTLVVALGLAPACGDDEPAEPAGDEPAAPEPVASAPAPAGDEGEPEEAEPTGPPKRIFAKRFVVNVRSRPDEEAPRIGYLRAGAVSRAKTAEPVGDTGCRGGWYELTTGGFVCNGRDVVAFYGERLPEVQAAQPDPTAKLPYQYGYSRKNNVPVYRNLPSDEEAAQYEGYRIPGQEPPELAEGDDADGETGDGDTPEIDPIATATAPDTPTTEDTAEGGAEDGTPEEVAEEVDAGVPTLDSLMAEPDEEGEETILMRRMLKGFYVSLDRDFRRGARRYWRTQQNEYIPYHMLGLADGSDFSGVVLDGTEWELPLGWILSSRRFSYLLRGESRVVRGPKPGYHYMFRIAGEETFRTTDYVLGHDGRYYRDEDVRRVEVAEPPEEIGPYEKWIDVDLTRQTLVAYEGERPVYVTLISSGRILREGVPDLDHRTPTGTFRINAKHLATTMDGDNAFDGPYSIQDVPYVMYYEMGYALHMAFWHDAFGRPKSHGCVNMSPTDARWIFNWSEPQLPDGWHGVYPDEDNPGTLIRIRGETPPG